MILPALPFMPFFPVTIADFLPRDTPASYIRRRRQQQQRKATKEEQERQLPVMVCIGDSLTHGSISADWVSLLSKNLQSTYIVQNSGKNSETFAAIRARLDDIIQVSPDVVTLMIGTNDLIGLLEPQSAGLMYRIKLWWAQKTIPSLDQYAKELESTIKYLDTHLQPNAKIAIMSPPPLGEGGSNGRAWKQGSKMAEICSELCLKSSSGRVDYIPIYEIIKDSMVNDFEDKNQQSMEQLDEQDQQQLQRPTFFFDGREFSFRDAIPLTSVVVPWQRLIFQQSYSEIRKANNYKYTIDGVHFGDEFAESVNETILSWLQQQQQQQEQQ